MSHIHSSCAGLAVTVLVGLLTGAVDAFASGPTSQPATTEKACIGIVLPSATGVDGDATQFGTSLRELFMSYLSGPSLSAIALDARLPSQAIEEARQKDCGHVLLVSVSRKRNDNRLGRALGRAAGTAAVYGVPYAGGAAAAAARGAAVSGAYAIASMAENTRARDELTLEYRIGAPQTVTRATPHRDRAEADTDREDLLTPLVERASERIAETVLKR